MRNHAIMKESDAIDRLGALAQKTRLAAFRLVVRSEPQGIQSGEIARQLRTNATTMSRHLAQLERCSLLKCRRVKREAWYTVNWKGTDRLLNFLTEDCCKIGAKKSSDAIRGG